MTTSLWTARAAHHRWGGYLMVAMGRDGPVYDVTDGEGYDVLPGPETGWSEVPFDACYTNAALAAARRRDDCDIEPRIHHVAVEQNAEMEVHVEVHVVYDRAGRRALYEFEAGDPSRFST